MIKNIAVSPSAKGLCLLVLSITITSLSPRLADWQNIQYSLTKSTSNLHTGNNIFSNYILTKQYFF